MSFERTRPWFRVLTVFLAMSWMLLLPADGVLSAFAQESPQQLFDAGVAAYKRVELEKAEQHLLRAAELLQSREQKDAGARRLGAQVHLYLGRVTLVADKPEQARAHFRKALELDPSLVMVTETDPPRIVQAFEAAKTDLTAAQTGTRPARVAPTPAAVAVTEPVPAAKPKRKKKWIWWAVGGAAVAAVGIVALGAGGGGGTEDVALGGNWTISRLDKVTASCGDGDYLPGLDSGDMAISQSGSQLTVSPCCVNGMLNGSVDGRAIDFSGRLSNNDGSCLSTEDYSGTGSVTGSGSSMEIDGEFQLILNRTPSGPTSQKAGSSALPPCPFQCTFKFSYTMLRP